MCGIAGYVGREKPNLQAMVDALRHRGPDNTGSFSAEIDGVYIGLGHTRLSIVDISDAGNQPMATANDELVLVFNGEAYNFMELRQKYLRNFAFESNTDSETLLYLYQQLGVKMLDELVGDFALAILDQKQTKLYLVRDRMGVKPLYYKEVGNQLYFASEIKSILAAGAEAELNTQQLQNFFAYKYVPGNETLFEGIKRVPPASYIEYDYRELKGKIVPYWKPKKRKEIEDLSFAEACEVTQKLISKSVELQQMADVPIGNFLSGGLDSSIIAYYLKDKRKVVHYCARKQQEDLQKEGTTSDFSFAHQLAESWGLNFKAIKISSEELTEELLRTVLNYSDDLIADGSQIPSYLITQQAANTSKVVLSGMGADELFLGYAGHQLAYLSQHYSLIPPQIFANLQAGKGKMKAYKRYLKKWGEYHQYGKVKYGMYNVVGNWQRSLSVYSGEGNPAGLLENYFENNQPVWDNMFRFETENFLVKNLHYFDRMCMASSVEGRVPFLDHRIVEFAWNIKPEYKLKTFRNPKRILKEAYKKELPKEVISRRKAGFGMPLRSIFSKKENINRLLDTSFFGNFNGFSVPEIQQVIDHHIQGKEDNSSIIFALVCFQHWYKMYIGK